MAHYAKVVNGMVHKVIVIQDESFWDNFIDDSPGEYIKCSYNTRGGIHYDPVTGEPSDDQSKALRKNYPGCTWYYNSIDDAFYPPQPYQSWTLNTETYLWEAPSSMPNDGFDYAWNENTLEWVQLS